MGTNETPAIATAGTDKPVEPIGAGRIIARMRKQAGIKPISGSPGTAVN